MVATIPKGVALGFTQQQLQRGLHICQIYGEEEERENAVLKFLLSGIRSGECTCCFSENTSEQQVRNFFEEQGESFLEAKSSGQLAIFGARDVYFENGCFDPGRMLQLLRHFYENSMAHGYSGARVIGEMTAEVLSMPGGSRLLEYEAKVSILIRTHPVTAVCQYDARAYKGAAILDILKVHPLMVVRGAVTHNPFFIPPDQFLTSCA